MPPRAHFHGPFRRTELEREADIFTHGMSWALCFFEGKEDPKVQEFRPPSTANLYLQSVAIYIPYHILLPFAAHKRLDMMTLQPYLPNKGAHCRIRVFKCDNWGTPLDCPYTFHIKSDRSYKDEHFKFVGELMSPAYTDKKHICFHPGTYFLKCEFYKGPGEGNVPDATYITGRIEVANTEGDIYLP